MALLSFLKRTSGDLTKAPPVTRSADSVQDARTRARQRLIGAVVLVAVGVIGFPLLFETKPRPLPVDTPIEIIRKDSPEQASLTPPRPVLSIKPKAEAPPGEIIETPADAGREVQVQKASPVAHSASMDETKADAAGSVVAPVPTPVPSKPTENTRAQAVLDGVEDGGGDATEIKSSRFVVQVGAFSEASAAHEMRQKLEKLGIQTYTQIVDSSQGRRIRVRVGPFASREDADRVASKVKVAGLSPAVYAL